MEIRIYIALKPTHLKLNRIDAEVPQKVMSYTKLITQCIKVEGIQYLKIRNKCSALQIRHNFLYASSTLSVQQN